MKTFLNQKSGWLAVVFLAAGAAINACGADSSSLSDLMEPAYQKNWSVEQNRHAGKITSSGIRWDEQNKTNGAASLACDVVASIKTNGAPAGYINLKWTAPQPVRLTDYNGVRFSYMFPTNAAVASMWLQMGGITKDNIPIKTDGQWHEVNIPLFEKPADFTTNSASSIHLCFYVYPPEADKEILFSPRFDRLCLEPKDPTQASKPAMLIIGSGFGDFEGALPGKTTNYKLMPRVEEELKSLGLNRVFQFTNWERITLPYLKAFNGVILSGYPLSSQGGVPEKVKEKITIIRQYVEEGGSIFMANGAYMAPQVPTMNELLKPMNGEVLYEAVFDKTNRYVTSYPCPALDFNWTGDIAKSPLTEGVQGLYYDAWFCEPGSPNVLPIRVSSDWQLLVKGEATAASYMLKAGTSERMGVGSYTSSPALLAAREYGKGRVVLWPQTMMSTLQGYHWMLEKGVVMDSNAGGRRSNGAKLLYNLLQWMTEPSCKLQEFGGHDIKLMSEVKSVENELGFQKIEWTKENPVKPIYKKAFRGLLGAISALSSGKDSPEEMIRAAKAAGYDFIVFTEDFEVISKENWDRLVKACREASTNTFYAFPGFYYKIWHGAEYVTFGGFDDLSIPRPEMIKSVEGKQRLQDNDAFVRGMKVTPPIIMVYPGRNPRPLRLNAMFYGFATHTYEADVLKDEKIKSFMELNREGLFLFPAAVHFARSAEDVLKAAKSGFQFYIRADSPDSIPRSVQGMNDAFGRWYKPAFVSSGPEIQYHCAENWGTADLARPGNDRHRIQILVKSESGIREIRIYDNTKLFRRFLAKGAREYSVQVDNYHDMAHSYITEVIDQNGGTAFSWDRSTNFQECYNVMCSDNANDMPGGKYNSTAGSDDEGIGEVSAPGAAQVVTWPCLVNSAKYGGGHGNFASLKQNGMITRYGWILDYSLDHVYADNGSTGGIYDNKAVLENPCYTGRIREYLAAGIRPKTYFTICEGEVMFSKDMDKVGPMLVGQVVVNPGAAKALKYVFPKEGKTSIVADFVKSSGRMSGELMPNEYVGVFPKMVGVFNMGDLPLTYETKGANFWITSPKSLFKKGDKLSWRIMFAGGMPFSDNSLMEDIRHKMGLSGEPAYKVAPSVGSVESTRLYLTLKAEDYGFRGTISRADLPVMLTVFVRGLNPKWSAGLWYKGKNKLAVVEWPHKVVARDTEDEIYRMGVMEDGGGYAQIDVEEKDRDVFLGNFYTSDNPDLWLTFVQDPERVYVVAHNPTDKDIKAKIQSGPGFDLYGNFKKKVMVPAGSSIEVDIVNNDIKPSGNIVRKWFSR